MPMVLFFRLRWSNTFSLFLLNSSARAVNSSQCYHNLVSGVFGNATAAGALDIFGTPVSQLQNASAITYTSCLKNCPDGLDALSFIDWSQFLTQISGWVVPWLALLSQLPYGAQITSDNLVSMLLALGSPALAAYSLSFTALNRRWLSQALSGINYPNVDRAYRVLDKLQQAPLHVEVGDGLLASLVVLPENDSWWAELEDRLSYPHTWTTAVIFQMLWVGFAYVLSLATSFSSGNDIASGSGGDTGVAFLWLLPIVLGWLQISPTCSYSRLKNAVEMTNSSAVVATENKTQPQRVSTLSCTNAIDLRLPSPSRDSSKRDMEVTSPIFNYSRFYVWSKHVDSVVEVFRNVSQNARQHRPVDPSRTWQHSESAISKLNRIGTRQQVISYASYPGDPSATRRFKTEFRHRFIYASLLALAIQWGTSGPAFFVSYITPPRGLGCRSAPWLLYGCTSTVVWVLMMLSAFLVDYPLTSVIIRRMGKVIATANSVFVVAIAVIDALDIEKTCYCGSARLFLGHRAFVVLVHPADEISIVNHSWAGAITISTMTAGLFTFLLTLTLRNPLPSQTMSHAIEREWPRMAEAIGRSAEVASPFGTALGGSDISRYASEPNVTDLLLAVREVEVEVEVEVPSETRPVADIA